MNVEQAATMGAALARAPLAERMEALDAILHGCGGADGAFDLMRSAAKNALLAAACPARPRGAVLPSQTRGPRRALRRVTDVRVVGQPIAGAARERLVEAVVDGHRSMLRSAAGSPAQLTRHGCFDSDLFATACFARVGVLVPQAELVDVSGARGVPPGFGPICLDQEFLDDAFARAHGGSGISTGTTFYELNRQSVLAMLAVDFIRGDADRTSNNYFAVQRGAAREPVPFDYGAGTRTALTDVCGTAHSNFVCSYGTPRQLLYCALRPTDKGSIPLLVRMNAFVYESALQSAAARHQLLDVVDRVVGQLSDAFLKSVVQAWPGDVIPPGVVASHWRESIGHIPAKMVQGREDEMDALYAHLLRSPLSGAALFAARKKELVRVAAWRRDHLKDALREYFALVPPRDP